MLKKIIAALSILATFVAIILVPYYFMKFLAYFFIDFFLFRNVTFSAWVYGMGSLTVLGMIGGVMYVFSKYVYNKLDFFKGKKK